MIKINKHSIKLFFVRFVLFCVLSKRRRIKYDRKEINLQLRNVILLLLYKKKLIEKLFFPANSFIKKVVLVTQYYTYYVITSSHRLF